MANFDGFTPHPIERFTSLFEQDDATNAPLGVAAVCRNSHFHLTSVRSRDGINQKVGNASVGVNMGTGFAVTGAYSFKYSGNGVLPDKQVPMVFDQNGTLMIESPPGSGTMKAVQSAQVTPGAGNYLQADQTLNRAYLAFTNIANPAAAGSSLGVYDLNTGILDPLSMRPVGGTWTAGTQYAAGEVVTPVLGGNGFANGHSFRCTTAGTSGANEPAWNPGDATTTNDGTVVWTENTLIFASAVPPVDRIFNGLAGVHVTTGLSGASPASGVNIGADVTHAAGGYAANRDVYFGVSLVSVAGETTVLITNTVPGASGGPAILNSANNDQLNVKLTGTVRAWLSALGAGVKPTGWNLYVADVATGAAAPALATYQKVAGGPFSLAVNTQVNVNSTPATTSPPTTNTALLIGTAGNVDTGTRWAVVLYVNRNGYISGWGFPSPVSNTYDPLGQILALNITIGPPNTAQRIVAFSQAGGTSAGPYAYIPQNDSFNGIQITSTVINDNVTTTATFNFVDLYLENLMATTTNVTTFFDKILVPPCRSVAYLQTLDRMAYLAYSLPSGAYITPPRDPETVFGSNGFIQVAETDGQNLMALIDFKGIIYALKEASGHEMNPSSDNPAQWTSTKRWTGMGPCGLRAFDSGTHFFVFVHRSGIYACWGDIPTRLVKEIPLTWGRVNWSAAQTIWVKIDEDTHEVKIGLPLDRATVPSHTLTMNYEEDINLNPPIHSTIYSRGKFISSAAARKWSLDDIAANSCVRTKRTVLNPPAQIDSATTISQLWFASSFDSAVRAQTPGYYFDDWSNSAIAMVYETVCPGDALKVNRLGGVQALLSGQGAVAVSVLAGSAKATQDGGLNVRTTEIRLKDAIVKPGTTTDYKCQGSGMNERYRIRFSCQGKPAGTWADLKGATLFLNPVFQARAN